MDNKEILKEIDCKTACRIALVGWADEQNEEIEKLKAQLAEAEKPELRHGDYGIYDNNKSFVVVEQTTLHGTPKAFYEDQSGLIHANKKISPHFRLGNIFDDIEKQ